MEMEISIFSDPGGRRMKLGIDGESVLEVKPLKWKFRGSDGVGVTTGGRIQVSWDLHGWFFRREGGGGGDSSVFCEQKGEAVFVFQFSSGDGDGKLSKGSDDVFWEGGERGILQKRNLSESSSGSSSATVSSASMEDMSCVEQSEAGSSGEVGFTLIICRKEGLNIGHTYIV
ncbi:hypothetical protein HPP92_021637 [Vanilla planifolia]|uniref:Uncharacterized protein n=1 Tax=Vanilla planifolia TaxID=51239 RepID=A0A835PZ81_VANPL|nr:hypothetical protein HPP92_021637 [Vanilla planifolia]